MKRVILQRNEIYSGSLILVNRAYAYKEPEKDAGKESLMPVLEQEPEILMQRRAAVLLFHLMDKINGWRGIVPVSGWRSGREQKKLTLEEYIDFLRQFPYGEKPFHFAEGGREFLVSSLEMPGAGKGTAEDSEEIHMEIDETHPYWISGNNVDGFVITQERSRHGY